MEKKQKKPVSTWRDGVFHVELQNCIVNIRPEVGEYGNVDNIQIIPDDYAGFEVKVEPNVRSIRVVKKRT